MHPKFSWSRNEVGSPRSTSFVRIFQVGLIFSVLPASLISSTYTDKNSPFARLTNEHSLFRTFPYHVPIELSQIAFPITVLPKDDRIDSFREDRLGLPYWTMILAICALVDVACVLRVPCRLLWHGLTGVPRSDHLSTRSSLFVESLSTGPSASRNNFSVSTITDGYARAGEPQLSPALT